MVYCMCTCALNSDFGLALLQMIGYLNFQLWTGVEGILVDDLRMDRRFPHQPTVSGCMLRKPVKRVHTINFY